MGDEKRTDTFSGVFVGCGRIPFAVRRHAVRASGNTSPKHHERKQHDGRNNAACVLTPCSDLFNAAELPPSWQTVKR